MFSRARALAELERIGILAHDLVFLMPPDLFFAPIVFAAFGALAKRVLQVDRDAVFFQDVGESFVGELLNRRHPVAPQLGQLIEGIVVEGDQLPHLQACILLREPISNRVAERLFRLPERPAPDFAKWRAMGGRGKLSGIFYN